VGFINVETLHATSLPSFHGLDHTGNKNDTMQQIFCMFLLNPRVETPCMASLRQLKITENRAIKMIPVPENQTNTVTLLRSRITGSLFHFSCNISYISCRFRMDKDHFCQFLYPHDKVLPSGVPKNRPPRYSLPRLK